MNRMLVKLCCAGLSVIAAAALMIFGDRSEAAARSTAHMPAVAEQQRPIVAERRFDIEVLVNGYPLEEYYSRGRSYVEAAGHRVRSENSQPVALSSGGCTVGGWTEFDRRTADISMECK